MKFIIFGLFMIISIESHSQSREDYDFNELNELILQKFGDDFEFSVLIEVNNLQIYSDNYMKSETLHPEEDSNHKLYNIASITKSITAVGIMKLVEVEEISLSDTLGMFFKGIPHPKGSITISNLLSHKSGLPQSYPLSGISESAEALNLILNQQLEFDPGTGFRYSNQNYQLLALIIEKVSQIPFEDFIRKTVLYPLKMNNTIFWDETNENMNIANLNDRVKSLIGKRNWGFNGGVGMFSTTSDLFKFWNGIYKDGFLSRRSINLMFQPYHKTNSGTEVGLGFFKSPETKWNQQVLWTRGTESWGHNSAISYYSEKDVTIIVLTASGEIDNDRNKTGNRLISDLIATFLFD